VGANISLLDQVQGRTPRHLRRTRQSFAGLELGERNPAGDFNTKLEGGIHEGTKY